MNWYKAKDQDTYLAYLSNKGAGLWVHYNPASERIDQIEFTNKLYDENKIKNMKGYVKPSSSIIDEIWKQIIEHTSWDKMLISQIFET